MGLAVSAASEIGRRYVTPAVLLALDMLALTGSPSPANAYGLPRPGVVCDKVEATCYTDQGPSVAQTGREYGRRAQEHLLRSLSGRPPVTVFRLSGGELCDLRQRRCWDDGNQRRNPSNTITRQLFGSASGNSQGWGDNAQSRRQCQLEQRGRNLFRGPCDLEIDQVGPGITYRVVTDDGRNYIFTARGNQLLLRDATGLWPVDLSERDDQLLFRWSDLELKASRSRSAIPERNQGPSRQQQNLKQLLKSLFP